MFLDGWKEYFDPQNASRITGLSIHDPFAILGGILLILMVPVFLILLTVTARRSAESVWDGLRHDARYRALRRSARRSMLLPMTHGRSERRLDRAAMGAKRVSFILPDTPRTPKTPRTPTTPDIYGDKENAPMLPTQPSGQAARRQIPPNEPSPTGSSFEDVYDRWIEARKPPKVEVTLEDADAKRRWTSEFQEELRRTAVDVV